MPTALQNNLLRLLGFCLLLAAGLLILAAADFDANRLLMMVEATHPVSFVALMIVLPLVGFPIAAFYLYAGSAYPWWQAWLCCSLALAVNLGLAYPIAKHLLRKPLSEFLQRYSRSLPEFDTENQFKITFLVRSVPGIPFFLQNYLLPVIGVRFRQYWVTSWLLQSLFAAAMAAVPHFAKSGAWYSAALLLGVLILLAILHRRYVPPRPPR